MFLSVFEMFKVGIGPSSSHTMGPMVAAARFLDTLREAPFTAHGVSAALYGSLAFTGVGHATDRATILGLAGFRPESYDREAADAAMEQIRKDRQVTPDGLAPLAFDPQKDLRFDFGDPLPGHANGMILAAHDAQGDVIEVALIKSMGEPFDAAVLKAVRDFKFQPGLYQGTPVPVKIEFSQTFPIHFSWSPLLYHQFTFDFLVVSL